MDSILSIPVISNIWLTSCGSVDILGRPALSRFIDGIQHFRKVRLLGSAALSLCYVACGRVDAYREDNIMFWDVAAGMALVHSAGGSVEMEHFSHMGSPVNVTATNGLLKIDGMENSKRKRRS